MQTKSSEKFCTTRQAAQRLGVCLRTAQLWCESGILDAWKTGGGHRRISLTSVEKVLAGHTPTKHDHTPGMGQLKVLVVEDDNVLLKLYKMRMTTWGFPVEVITAANGYEALVLIGREAPDLMISDLGMEGINGFQMVRTVWNSPFKEGMEIAVVTGLGKDQVEAQGGLPAGVPFYTKPVPFDVLRELCLSLLERRRQGLSAS